MTVEPPRHCPTQSESQPQAPSRHPTFQNTHEISIRKVIGSLRPSPTPQVAGGMGDGAETSRGSEANLTRGCRAGDSEETNPSTLGYAAGSGNPALKLRMATGTRHSPFRGGDG